MPLRKIKYADSIYEELVDVDYDAFQRNLDDLVDVGYLTKEYDDDEDRTYFRAREVLTWSEVAGIACAIKKQILLSLIDNPKSFFVFYNTQKGKLRIGTEEIRMWASSKDHKVVGFLVVDNDKTLADQTSEGMIDIIKEEAHVFLLSSNNAKETIDSIRTYIDAYAADTDGEYKMPVVVALNNTTQLKKILMLMTHIKHKVEARNSQLRYGCVFDEADKVYPQIRNKEVSIGNGYASSLYNLLVEDDRAVYRLGFITATEGELMDNDYPECANAFMYPVPPGDQNYRAAHTTDAIIKHVHHRVKYSNDVYAESILSANKEHFTNKIVLKNGTEGFRKIIVNGDAKTESMDAFARKRIEHGAYAITVNMRGVVVYRQGYAKKRYSAKGIRFGQLLFNIYNELGLHDKPLFIIGRRKVDRGLGFHFAPRDGSDGLIWTDMILGRVDDKDTAVQKAGRLAGVIAQSPQYPGKLHWWTDEKTGNSIVRHNTIVDEANAKRGCSIVQAVEHAKSSLPDVLRVIDEYGPQAPEVVNMTEEEYATIPTTRDKNKKIIALLSILEKHNPQLAATLRAYDCKEITVPRDAAGQSYKNHIGVAVRCFEKRERCSVTLSADEREKGKIWNCFIDKHNTPKRACFVYVNHPRPKTV